MGKIGFYYNNQIDDVAMKRLKINVDKMLMFLGKVCDKTMSDASQEQKDEIYNEIYFNPKAYYEIYDDVESKSKKITFLDDTNEIVKDAEKLIIPIINKLRSGNSVANKNLDELLTNNNLKIRICPLPKIDAGCEYIPSQSSKGTINLGLCSGCFTDNVTADELAVTIGHEFGHALLEKQINIPHIECFEIENFCDIFGSRLAQAAGYNTQARSDYLSKAMLKGNLVHPDWKHRKKINDIFPGNGKEYKSLDKIIIDKFNRYNEKLIMRLDKKPNQNA